ncbi:lipase family protein [Williamsia maris]|uniref:Secretory lipase n=1 Tax=Williamsia maris TaxID=72806 RepID=A0ABT1HE00_9NOCA|nr:lipase family protein [Williamsia maris]MCP2176485.1 Secretory lipase [Williamsia maris]
MRTMLKSTLRVIGAGAAIAAVVATGTTAVANAAPEVSTATQSPADVSFYTPPSPLPAGNPGDLIRVQNFRTIIGAPSGNGRIPAKAARILYRSVDANGAPIAVSGYVLQSPKPWNGPGPRPVVAYAPGAHGQGDQCAPSRLLQSGATITPGGPMAEIESVITFNLLAKGYTVVSTDFVGLGTPGLHTFGVRLDMAHAVLDSARAVRQMTDVVDPKAKVAIAGYSEGGGAAAAAAEVASTYAPDLPLVGVYAGGTPTDLRKLMAYLDGNRLSAALAYAVNGLEERYPEFKAGFDPLLNATGKSVNAGVARECIVATSFRGRPQTKTWTKSGKSYNQVLAERPDLAKFVDEQNVGGIKPEVPVFLSANPDDPTVPPTQTRELYSKWCALKPESVQFGEYPFPVRLIGASPIGHIAGGITGFEKAFDWLQARFEGKAPVVGCQRS